MCRTWNGVASHCQSSLFYQGGSNLFTLSLKMANPHRTCFPRNAFRVSLAINLSVRRINELFLIRQHQSSVMKSRSVLNGRKQDIAQIMKDLNLQIDHVHHHRVTDTETNYLSHSYVGKLNPTYVDHTFMAHDISEILLHVDNTFSRIASKDSALLSEQNFLCLVRTLPMSNLYLITPITSTS